MRRSQTVAVLSCLLLSAPLFFVGCGGGFASDSCNAAIECEGGNDKDIDACVAATEGLGNEAAAYDCSDAFDKLIDCVNKTGVCKDQKYRSECGDEGDALAKCEKAASGRK